MDDRRPWTADGRLLLDVLRVPFDADADSVDLTTVGHASSVIYLSDVACFNCALRSG